MVWLVPLPALDFADLEDHYARRVRSLTEATRRVMLLAAADPTGDAVLVWRAAHTLGIGLDAAASSARSEQLLEIDSRVRFRHPLVRSASHGTVSAEDRRAADLALAAATDAQVDPERRVWHFASAATGPDEEVGLNSNSMAGRAQARAAPAAAAALEPLAAELLGTSQTAAMLRHARGRLRFAQHRWGEALVDFRAAGEIATRTRAISPCYLPWRSLAARAALAVGKPDMARA